MLISTVVKRSKALALLCLPVLAACGGSSSPSGPDTPTPTPGFGVSGIVFYDENANGVLDGAEHVRLPGSTVRIAGRTGQAAAGGRFTVSDVPPGTQTAQADPAGLPPYFQVGEPVSVTVPPQPGNEVAVPAVLEIGANRPNYYMAFGDSITSGDGGGYGGGYPGYLEADLRSYWGEATIVNAGVSGTRSIQGESRMTQELRRYRPAFTLILYGTNDWNAAVCRSEFPCYTIQSLRSMILQAEDARSNPIIGTIPPANPAWVDKGATERNIWVTQMNDLLRSMAQAEHVRVAEIHGDFMAQPSLPDLFSDHVHPNDAGYQLMARSWWDAITRPWSGAGASELASFGFTVPGAR
jgi:lysophospholipase L1-like esterase